MNQRIENCRINSSKVVNRARAAVSPIIEREREYNEAYRINDMILNVGTAQVATGIVFAGTTLLFLTAALTPSVADGFARFICNAEIIAGVVVPAAEIGLIIIKDKLKMKLYRMLNYSIISQKWYTAHGAVCDFME